MKYNHTQIQSKSQISLHSVCDRIQKTPRSVRFELFIQTTILLFYIISEIFIKWKAPDNFARAFTVKHFLRPLYDEDMKFAFATFQGGHGPLKLIAFEKSKKKRTLLYFLVTVSLTSPSLLLKFPIIFLTSSSCFNSNDVAFAS